MKSKLLEILLTYNKFENQHNEKIIDLRNELFHELKIDNIETLYEEFEKGYCIVKLEQEHEKHSNFIFSFVSKMSKYDEQSKDKRTSLKNYLIDINKSVLYYYRNILYHEITSIEELEELSEVLNFDEVLKLFEIDIDTEVNNKLVSYYNQRYEGYYKSKGYNVEHIKKSEKIDYVVYRKETSIPGITTHIFTHKDAKFYSVNISNYNHSSNENDKIVFKKLNTDLYFDIECTDDNFYIKLNYYVTECQCPIMIYAVYNVKKRMISDEKLFIPHSEEYDMFESKGDIFKNKSKIEYHQVMSKIKEEFDVCGYNEFWKILKPIAHMVVSDVESMKRV